MSTFLAGDKDIHTQQATRKNNIRGNPSVSSFIEISRNVYQSAFVLRPSHAGWVYFPDANFRGVRRQVFLPIAREVTTTRSEQQVHKRVNVADSAVVAASTTESSRSTPSETREGRRRARRSVARPDNRFDRRDRRTISPRAGREADYYEAREIVPNETRLPGERRLARSLAAAPSLPRFWMHFHVITGSPQDASRSDALRRDAPPLSAFPEREFIRP